MKFSQRQKLNHLSKHMGLVPLKWHTFVRRLEGIAKEKPYLKLSHREKFRLGRLYDELIVREPDPLGHADQVEELNVQEAG